MAAKLARPVLRNEFMKVMYEYFSGRASLHFPARFLAENARPATKRLLRQAVENPADFGLSFSRSKFAQHLMNALLDARLLDPLKQNYGYYIDFMVDCLHHDDRMVSNWAAKAIPLLGNEAVPYLSKALRRKHRFVGRAVPLLKQIGSSQALRVLHTLRKRSRRG